MIRDAREHNAAALTNTHALKRIQQALPELFASDGSFMIDRLTDALTDSQIAIEREGYELKFLGKSYAKLQTGTRTETVLVPDQEHNLEPTNAESENLYLVGDNLDALKHLIHSYAGRVTCIYIDPPYNTGSDGFVYGDSFGFTADQLVERLGLGEDEAERVLDMHGKSSHSAWLTFMYPRLVLARELLADDGVIFISIDENEQANLTLLCNEIFGEQNLVSTMIWRSTPGSNTGGDLKTVTEYVTVYAKRKPMVRFRGKRPDTTNYRRRDAHASRRGPYTTNKLDRRMTGSHYSEALNYPITMPDGTSLWPGGGSARQDHWNWRWSRQKLEWGIANDFILFTEQPTGWSVYFKQYLYVDNNDAPIERELPPQNLIELEQTQFASVEGANSARGTAEATSLLGAKLFDYPKPLNLLTHLLGMMADDSIVLDFFSGSATTAHAVMQLNTEDGGKRKFIMVQLPETIEPSKPAYSAGYRTIDEIGRERIRRAAAAIRERTGAEFDGGFRLVRIERPSATSITELEAFDPTLNAADLFPDDMTERFAFHGTPGHEVILATLLNEDGYGMRAQAQLVRLHEYDLAVYESSAYIVRPGITSHDVEELVRQLENDEIALERLVVFGYSIEFTPMQELQRNLAVMKSGKAIDIITRL